MKLKNWRFSYFLIYNHKRSRVMYRLHFSGFQTWSPLPVSSVKQNKHKVDVVQGSAPKMPAIMRIIWRGVTSSFSGLFLDSTSTWREMVSPMLFLLDSLSSSGEAVKIFNEQFIVGIGPFHVEHLGSLLLCIFFTSVAARFVKASHQYTVGHTASPASLCYNHFLQEPRWS